MIQWYCQDIMRVNVKAYFCLYLNTCVKQVLCTWLVIQLEVFWNLLNQKELGTPADHLEVLGTPPPELLARKFRRNVKHPVVTYRNYSKQIARVGLMTRLVWSGYIQHHVALQHPLSVSVVPELFTVLPQKEGFTIWRIQPWLIGLLQIQ